MKRTFKTVITALSLLLITSLVNVKEVRAEEVKKDQQAAKSKTSNQEKVKYSKQQKDAVIQKIKNKQNLTLEEQRIRIAILKEQYPIDWYEEMLGFKTSVMDGWCEAYEGQTFKCNPYPIVEHLTSQQIKSLILNLDDHWDDYRLQEMVKIVLTIVNEISGKQAFNVRNYSNDNSEFIINSSQGVLVEISKKDLKKKYNNIYKAYGEQDSYCGSYVKENGISNNCSFFLLSEVYDLAKNKFILQYWGCTLEELKDKCPIKNRNFSSN